MTDQHHDAIVIGTSRRGRSLPLDVIPGEGVRSRTPGQITEIAMRAERVRSVSRAAYGTTTQSGTLVISIAYEE
jgi:hypothetical protein